MKSPRHRSPRNDTQKCIRYNGTNKVERLWHEDAYKLVSSGKAMFVPKRIWKELHNAKTPSTAA